MPARIVAYYNDHGFLDAKIADPEITQDKEWLYVKFIVEEGTRYKVGTVDFTGDLLAGKRTAIRPVDHPEMKNISANRPSATISSK